MPEAPDNEHDHRGRPTKCAPAQHEFKPRVTAIENNATDGVHRLDLRTVSEVFCGKCGEVRELQSPTSDG